MAIPSFYCPEMDASESDMVTLSENESGHAIRSRRLGQGQAVNLLNGQGLVAKGNIVQIERRAVIVKIESYQHVLASQKHLTIAVAIPKGDRQKVMMDMLTQLGVSQIIPLTCERSVTRYSDNLRDKWQRSAVEASKQSQNPWLPLITQGYRVNELLELCDGLVVYADGQGESLSSVFKSAEGGSLTVIIGPEGGFSEAETNYLK